MRRVPCSRRSERSGLAKPINDGSYSWFDRHDLIGNFLMEPHGIVRLDYVLFKKPSRTYVLREYSRKRCKQIFINVRTTLWHFTRTSGRFDSNGALATSRRKTWKINKRYINALTHIIFISMSLGLEDHPTFYITPSSIHSMSDRQWR